MKKILFIMLMAIIPILASGQLKIKTENYCDYKVIPCKINGYPFMVHCEDEDSRNEFSYAERSHNWYIGHDIITNSLYYELKNKGYITDDDDPNSAMFKGLNGEIIEVDRVVIRDLQIGNFHLKNILVCVVPNYLKEFFSLEKSINGYFTNSSVSNEFVKFDGYKDQKVTEGYINLTIYNMEKASNKGDYKGVVDIFFPLYDQMNDEQKYNHIEGMTTLQVVNACYNMKEYSKARQLVSEFESRGDWANNMFAEQIFVYGASCCIDAANLDTSIRFYKNALNVARKTNSSHQEFIKDCLNRVEQLRIDKPTDLYVKSPLSNDDKVFDVVEQMPSFPGANGALMSYLSKNIIYPKDAEENGMQGRVICTFIVERDGSISNVKVAKSVYPSLDKEATRVVQGMPKWIPGKQNGDAVRVKYTLPVTFRMTDGPMESPKIPTYNTPKIDRTTYVLENNK